MKLSIIITVYNTKKDDLIDCINSIERQEFNDIEIIIVDDGSSDDLASFLEALAKKRKKIKVFHKKNEGVSIARNYGISKAQGECIMFIDADDELMPGALSDGMEMLIESQCDIVIGQICHTKRCDVQDIKKEGSTLKKRTLLSNSLDKNRYLAHVFDKKQSDWGRYDKNAFFNFEGCWARIIKTELARKTLFTPGMKICEDTEWSLNTVIQNPQIKIGLSYNLWYLYIDNSYSVLNTFKEDMPERIYKGIVNVENTIANQDLMVKNAYMQWVFIKLKQLIFDYYYAPECKLTCLEKIFSYRRFMRQPGLRNIGCYLENDFKAQIKWRMYKSGMAVAYYKNSLNCKKEEKIS